MIVENRVGHGTCEMLRLSEIGTVKKLYTDGPMIAVTNAYSIEK